jgi:hypothetical protein
MSAARRRGLPIAHIDGPLPETDGGYMGSPKRNELETFEMFKLRRKIERRIEKVLNKPKVFFTGGTYKKEDKDETKGSV